MGPKSRILETLNWPILFFEKKYYFMRDRSVLDFKILSLQKPFRANGFWNHFPEKPALTDFFKIVWYGKVFSHSHVLACDWKKK